MQPEVAAQLRVKAKREDAVMANRDGTSVMRCDHLDVPGAFDQRPPNEAAGKSLAIQAADVKRRPEAADLPAISVAADPDGQQAEPLLPRPPIPDVPGRHDTPLPRR